MIVHRVVSTWLISTLTAAFTRISASNYITANISSQLHDGVVLKAGYETDTNVSCQPHEGAQLVYNRIPKAGSEYMRHVLESFSREMNFTVESDTRVHKRMRNNRKFYKNLCDRSKSMNRSVVVGHFFYHDCVKYNKQDPSIWINVMRDPITRCASRLSYDERKKHHEQNNITILDECMSKESDLCAFEQWAAARTTVVHGIEDEKVLKEFQQQLEAEQVSSMIGRDERFIEVQWSRERNILDECSTNYQTRFFCGTGPECQSPGPLLLERAKENIKNHYIFVGLMEELTQTQNLLHHLLPDYFGVVSMQRCAKCGHNGPKSDGFVLSEKNRAILERLNAQDIELYEFVKQQFYETGRCVEKTLHRQF